MLRSAWFIAWEDSKNSLRQKETILWTFIMPIIFFYFIGTVTGGFGPSSSGAKEVLALEVPGEGGFLVDELQRRLEAEDYVVLRNPEAAEKYIRRLQIPTTSGDNGNFTDSVLAGEQAVIKFLRKGESLNSQYDEVRLNKAVYGVLADLIASTKINRQADQEAFVELAAMPRNLSLEVSSAGKRIEPPTGYSQTIPGTMVMFTMMILLTSGAILLLMERKQGLLRRLASTPIPRSSVVLGKWLGKLSLGFIQIAFAMLAGTVIFDMDWGPSLWMVCLILAGWAGFNASLGILLANVARSEGQVAGIATISVMVLAALGGCWWPIEVTPGWMQDLAIYLPTGWTMDAMHQLINFGNDAALTIPHLSAQVIGTLVLGILAVRTFRYD
ncbi:MAG: ABC transporter permease [Planctomycetota bacterium]